MVKKKSVRMPKEIDGSGDVETCFHMCIMAGRLRIQNNAGDVFYTGNASQVRKMARFLNKAADWLKHHAEKT